MTGTTKNFLLVEVTITGCTCGRINNMKHDYPRNFHKLFIFQNQTAFVVIIPRAIDLRAGSCSTAGTVGMLQSLGRKGHIKFCIITVELLDKS